MKYAVPVSIMANRDEARWNAAVNWLLNSRFMDPDALTMFWAIVDGDVAAANVERVPVAILRRKAERRVEVAVVAYKAATAALDGEQRG